MKIWEHLSENQNWTLGIALIALILSVVSFFYKINFDLIAHEIAEQGNRYEEIANNLNSVLVNNSNIELELLRKKISFEITQLLYEELYDFGKYNPEVISKLKKAADERKKIGNVSADNLIQNKENLLLYLNTFENVYEQCKRGMISLEDVRVNFKYLIGPTCNNQQVQDILKTGNNGLKLLCSKFYSGSVLGNMADSSRDSCF